MGLSASHIRNGLTIELDGEIYTVVEFQHVKPGKGQAFVRTKLKNIMTGAVLQRNFKIGEDVETVQVEKRVMEYLYNDGESYYFMDSRTYDQVAIPADEVGSARNYLIENMPCEIQFYQGRPIAVAAPDFVELEVVQTDPGLKGDTQSGGTKPATLETGIVIQVPLFIKVGDKVKVDTRDGSYVTRV